MSCSQRRKEKEQQKKGEGEEGREKESKSACLLPCLPSSLVLSCLQVGPVLSHLTQSHSHTLHTLPPPYVPHSPFDNTDRQALLFSRHLLQSIQSKNSGTASIILDYPSHSFLSPDELHSLTHVPEHPEPYPPSDRHRGVLFPDLPSNPLLAPNEQHRALSQSNSKDNNLANTTANPDRSHCASSHCSLTNVRSLPPPPSLRSPRSPRRQRLLDYPTKSFSIHVPTALGLQHSNRIYLTHCLPVVTWRS